MGTGELDTESLLKRREAIVIGRGVDSDIIISDAKASRKHCRISRGREPESFHAKSRRYGVIVPTDLNQIWRP